MTERLPGSVFHEPPQTLIRRFGNLSATSEATFIAFHPLSGEQPLIQPA
jgi:hypothetical protein